MAPSSVFGTHSEGLVVILYGLVEFNREAVDPGLFYEESVLITNLFTSAQISCFFLNQFWYLLSLQELVHFNGVIKSIIINCS
jgi:hypothetical protein